MLAVMSIHVSNTDYRSDLKAIPMNSILLLIAFSTFFTLAGENSWGQNSLNTSCLSAAEREEIGQRFSKVLEQFDSKKYAAELSEAMEKLQDTNDSLSKCLSNQTLLSDLLLFGQSCARERVDYDSKKGRVDNLVTLIKTNNQIIETQRLLIRDAYRPCY